MSNNFKPTKYDIKEYKEADKKKITLSEMYGRYFFKENVLNKKYNPNYVLFTAPIFENWDVELSTPEGRKYFEIKMRNETYEKMIMEVDKYNNLMKNNKLSYYVNITTDTNKLFVWDLNKIDINNIKIEDKYCPRTTYSDRNDYVLKKCYMLPTKDATYTQTYNYSITQALNNFQAQLNNNQYKE